MAANNSSLALLIIEDEKSLNNIIVISKIMQHKGYKDIINLLMENGSANVTTMYVKLRTTQPVISQFLSKLRKFGMVKAYRNGKEIKYSVNVANMNTYINFLKNAPKIKETSIETQ